MSRKRITLGISLTLTTDKSFESVGDAVRKGLYYGLDTKRIASPSEVENIKFIYQFTEEIVDQTPVEVEESNRLIANFMGIRIIDEDVIRPDLNCFRLSEVGYHKSWDWLMPVINKIERMCNYNNVRYNVLLSEHSLLINPHVTPEVMICEYAEDKLDAAWKTVVKFITWYNMGDVYKPTSN